MKPALGSFLQRLRVYIGDPDIPMFAQDGGDVRAVHPPKSRTLSSGDTGEGDGTVRPALRAPSEMRLGQPASVSSACSRYVYSIILNKFLHIARHTFLQFGLPL